MFTGDRAHFLNDLAYKTNSEKRSPYYSTGYFVLSMERAN
jgi:hypothetical protein